MNNLTGVMTILPPKEGFSPDHVGAIGLLVYRLMCPGDLIVGQSLTHPPFEQTIYLPVYPSWFARYFKNFAYALGIVKYIRQYQPKLIEIHNRPELALWIAKKFPEIKVTITFHNNPLDMRGAKTVQQRQDLLLHVNVIVVSQWLKEQFLLNIQDGMVSILPNSICLQDIPTYVPITQRNKTILFVGRVVADKGADLFVKIGKRLLAHDPTWNIELIGADRFSKNSPETSFMRQVRQDIDQYPIQMTGYLPHQQVLQKIANATVVIMPSRWQEPFGMTALEAMACGTLLLVSAKGALPWVVGDGALIIDPENIDDSFAILLKLLQNTQLQENLSQKAIKRAFLYNSEDAMCHLISLRQQICPALNNDIYKQKGSLCTV